MNSILIHQNTLLKNIQLSDNCFDLKNHRQTIGQVVYYLSLNQNY